ncbi:MAG: hypothetical protein M1819_001496 [Sarea resinae]|nr:MAG: hypothetical protein M1819_001496 [Sarea resinae]
MSFLHARSGLCLEPLSPHQSDSSYLGSDSDGDDERPPEAKRRRIEEIAQQYLSGQPLFILSAGIKGPLGEDWINPWASKKLSKKAKTNESKGDIKARALHRDSKVRRENESIRRKIEISPTEGFKGPDRAQQSPAAGPRPKRKPVQRNSSKRGSSPASRTGADNNTAIYDTHLRPSHGLAVQPAPSGNNDYFNSRPGASLPTGQSWLKSGLPRLKPSVQDGPPSPTPLVPLRRPSMERQPDDAPESVHPEASYPSPMDHETSKTPPIGETGNLSIKEQFLDPGAVNVVAQAALDLLGVERSAGTGSDKSPSADSAAHSNLLSVKKSDSKDQQLSEANNSSPLSKRKPKKARASISQPVPGPQESLDPNHVATTHRRGSFHTLPSSTNLPAFDYRRVTRSPGSLTPQERDVLLPVTKNKEIAKKHSRRRANQNWSGDTSHISIPSDAVKSNGQNTGTDVDVGRRKDDGYTKPQPEASPASQDPPRLLPSSKGSDRILEADLILHNPSTAVSSTVPDRQDSKAYALTAEEEYDTYLSTQAAILKAQSEFQADIVSPLKNSSILSPTIHHPHSPALSTPPRVSQGSPTAITPFRTFRTPSVESVKVSFTVNHEDLLSTQDMLNAASPFAVSTVKKEPETRKRASFAAAVEVAGQERAALDDGGFKGPELDMETSPDSMGSGKEAGRSLKSALRKPASKTVYSLPPASITPQGTLGESHQQDGQAKVDEAFLSAMIDDVGSFLESWDVDTELKHNSGVSKGSLRGSGSEIPAGSSTSAKSRR